MKGRVFLLIGTCLLIYMIALFKFNQTSIPSQEAIQIAKKATPISDGYRISQIGVRISWSFTFLNDPVYNFNVFTVKYEPGFQVREYKIKVNAETKDVIEIKEIVPRS
ncbi:PepSY domain-containing protein [Bacillus sp. FJAT-28004]|uniref:PepSY domain-containing protein n=1 Tax=Bacillus sp. FJAT-28004 TaxID=1679165 RepID=UPI0006B5B47E|nr:PepSY domain-containing protein [Bacillus sp. FJAT-28004]